MFDDGLERTYDAWTIGLRDFPISLTLFELDGIHEFRS